MNTPESQLNIVFHGLWAFETEGGSYHRLHTVCGTSHIQSWNSEEQRRSCQERAARASERSLPDDAALRLYVRGKRLRERGIR